MGETNDEECCAIISYFTGVDNRNDMTDILK